MKFSIHFYSFSVAFVIKKYPSFSSSSKKYFQFFYETRRSYANCLLKAKDSRGKKEKLLDSKEEKEE